MFGPLGASRYLQQREDAKSMPRRDVTYAEFVEAEIAAGMTREKAVFHANVAMGLGDCHAAVGNEMLRIVKDKP